MIGSCVRCQRDGVRHSRAEVLCYGLALCFPHESQFYGDLDSLDRLDSSDPERAHGLVDEVLLRWAPYSLARAASSALERQPWVADA